MSVKNEFVNLVRLGDYITQRREKNDNLDVPIRGVTNSGFIHPKQLDADTSLYNVFYKNDFVFNPARMELNSISLNLEYEQAICSSLYEIFYVNNTEELLPEYLNLFIKRDEFARFCWYDAIGSARNYFRVANLQEILFPLPGIDIQQEFVDTYNGLKALAEQNEALIKPLAEACQAYIIDCTKKYPEVELDGYIDFYSEKNSDCQITLEQGINIDKVFINPHRPNSDLSSRIVVRKGQFAYCTQLNNENVAIAYREGEDCVVSPVYKAFEIKQDFKDILLPKYLFLWLKRQEFGRFVYWRSVGSAYEFLQEENIREYKIPIPSPEVQQAIVDVYNCAEEAKRIATEAREKMTILCPALVQKALHE